MRVVLAGIFGVVGGGLLTAGPYLPFGDQTGSEIDLVTLPTPLLLVVLAGLLAAAGLGSILFSRRPFGTAMVGLSIAPAAAAAALRAPRVLDVVLSSQGRDSLRIGGWLVCAGTVLALLAGLLAFVVTLSRLGARRGASIPFLGALCAAGLLQWWLVSPTDQGNTPGPHYLVIDAGGSVWPGVTVLGALALVVTAVMAASARCGAASVGTALGATLAVGLELGARYTVDTDTLRQDLGGDLREVSVILTGTTAILLLLLTTSLAVTTSRQAAEAARAQAWQQTRADTTDDTAGWEQPNPPDPWPPTDQASSTGAWGKPEATGTNRSWSSSDTSATDWPRT
ncbi:MAG TPA: hypothetical protein VIS06_14160 [Mycobacteriales bacterium]